MKWKQDVSVNRKGTYTFSSDKQVKEAAEEDYYLIDAIEKGMTDDKELAQLVVEKEELNEAAAGFRLAQFILDYGEFISNDLGHMIIKV